MKLCAFCNELKYITCRLDSFFQLLSSPELNHILFSFCVSSLRSKNVKMEGKKRFVCLLGFFLVFFLVFPCCCITPTLWDWEWVSGRKVRAERAQKLEGWKPTARLIYALVLFLFGEKKLYVMRYYCYFCYFFPNFYRSLTPFIIVCTASFRIKKIGQSY